MSFPAKSFLLITQNTLMFPFSISGSKLDTNHPELNSKGSWIAFLKWLLNSNNEGDIFVWSLSSILECFSKLTIVSLFVAVTLQYLRSSDEESSQHQGTVKSSSPYHGPILSYSGPKTAVLSYWLRLVITKAYKEYDQKYISFVPEENVINSAERQK